MTQHQDVYYIPPPRVVGGARGNSAPVSTATLGLIHRQDPSLAAPVARGPRLHDDIGNQTQSLQHHAPHQDWHVGPVGFPLTMGRGDASPRWCISILDAENITLIWAHEHYLVVNIMTIRYLTQVAPPHWHYIFIHFVISHISVLVSLHYYVISLHSRSHTVYLCKIRITLDGSK